MITEDHGVRQLAANTHRPHTDAHDRAERTTIHTHTREDIHRGRIYLLGGRHHLSFYLSYFLPSSSLSLFLCHSGSVRTPLAPVAVTMRCRQRPQHVHCLGDERQTDTRSASIRPCARPSLPPLPCLSPVSRLLLILLTIFPGSPSSLSLSLCLPAFPSPSGLRRRSYHQKKKKTHNRNKQTPPPTSLF